MRSCVSGLQPPGLPGVRSSGAVTLDAAAGSAAVERMHALVAVTAARALSADERAKWFAPPPLVEAASIIDRVDGPWPGELEGLDELGPFFVRGVMRAADGGRFALRVGVEWEPPHRIVYASRFHYPEGVTARAAVDGDGDALVELERRTPVVDGGVRRSYDRRGGWFDQIHLMDEATVVVALIDDRIVGVHVDAIHTVPLDVPRRLAYRLRTRVDPAYQGNHVWPALNGAAVDVRLPFERLGWGFDSEEMYMAVGNERIRELATMVEWGTSVERLIIDCMHAQRAGPVQTVTEAQVDDVTEMLRGVRASEVGYPYQTPVDVRQRFARASSVYGWPNLWRHGNAIVGIWNEGLGITIEHDDNREDMSCAIALDYGCLPGHTDDLVALVHFACARLHDNGITHLIMYTSSGAQLRDVLAPLATRIEQFGRRIRVAEPPDTARRGIYVDPIYF
jgi:hypothetical protein